MLCNIPILCISKTSVLLLTELNDLLRATTVDDWPLAGGGEDRFFIRTTRGCGFTTGGGWDRPWRRLALLNNNKI